MNNRYAFVTLAVVIILIIGSVSTLYVYDPKILGLAPSATS